MVRALGLSFKFTQGMTNSHLMIVWYICEMVQAFRTPSPVRASGSPLSPTSTQGDSSPAATQRYSSSPEMPRKIVKAEVSCEEIVVFFLEAIPATVLELAEKRGFVFGYSACDSKPFSKDKDVLKEMSTLMCLHLARHPVGFFLESQVLAALIKLRKFRTAKLDGDIILKVQAGNYIRYFSDLRAIKRASVTGIRHPSWLAQLLKAMKLSGHSYVFIICMHHFGFISSLICTQCLL